MAAKEKEEKKKPVIKVEEIKETEAPNEEGEKDAPEGEVKEPKTKIETPAVSSFSQLDTSAPPSPAKDSSVEEKKDSSEKEEASEKVVIKEEEKGTEKSVSDKEQISSDEVKEWLKDVRPDTTKDNEKSRFPSGKLVLLIVIILVLVGAVVGGVMYFQKGVNSPSEDVTPTEEPAKETPVPTQVLEEEVVLSTVTISVLNGSGIAGEAGKVKDLLTAGEFSEDNIKTGNAESYDYENVTVSVKDETPETVYNAINELLADNYEVSQSEDTLSENSDYDIMIIVGQ